MKELPSLSPLNDIILLREGREFSSETDPFFFRIIHKDFGRWNIVLIDNEDGVEHLVASMVPSKREIWSVKTRHERLLAIIKTIHQVYSMFFEGDSSVVTRRYDEVEADDDEGDDEDVYEIDHEAQVLAGAYGWPSGKYSTV
jgi:hypothetical protein